MVMINFSLLDEPLTIKAMTTLVVQDVSVFSSLIRQCYQYGETNELQLFDTKLKALKESEVMLITDILGYDVNAPAILKMIHADLEESFNSQPEVKSMIEKLAATITELIAFECLENELDLEYDEITILELIKALGVKVETQSDTIFDKCLEILQVFKYLSKKKLLIFVNCGSYLTKEELLKLREYIELSQQTVLLLEPRSLYDIPQYVLDEDYFLIAENMP
ncbi:type II-A CRISPR-associated protein Csn2 [Streptococcus halichoeri]|uniref:type II-A CRISPR-associated protein Csn2 n=1 Tax=Streptococcus halichoeri TaxID=254785 RepID=UPI000DB410C3|nr:type II-A CRISPR-associated protein Csn2 [Streptococcus halichoeri]PZO95677.1 MAG: type II-A CRISPR-associated protein Csn2 [Streptococcus pyogenes]